MLEDFFKLANEGEHVGVEACLEQLTAQERAYLADHSSRLNFRPGDEVIRQGYLANQLLLLEKGFVRLDICSDEHKRTIQLIKPLSFVGIICTFASRTVNFSSTAISDCTISIMDRSAFEHLLEQNGKFALKVIRMMSGMASDLVYHMTRFDGKQVDGALALVLLEFADTFGSLQFQLPFSRVELARMLGYSKESIVHTLSRFNRDGLVEVQDRTIRIPRRENLELIARKG
jgi:CRP-like cAMP-binding protein